MMKYSFLILVSALMFFISCKSDEDQTVTTLNNLVMADEFDIEGMPDSKLWNIEIGTGQNGWGNNELQYYTGRSENVKVDNGFLIITAIEENYKGSKYTSARLTTKGLFSQKYGRFEARIKMPYGKGYWPAFWLLGNNIDEVQWPNCGEIDIMEYLGNAPTASLGSVHGPGYSAGEAVSKKYNLVGERFDTGFHVFGIEWGSDYINYYVDGDLYNQITPDDVNGEWVFDQPFFIILNMAIGGELPGSPNSETKFPQTMIVDYVRVYQ